MQQMRMPDENIAFLGEENVPLQPGLVHRRPPVRHFGIDAVKATIAEPVWGELMAAGDIVQRPGIWM